MKFYKVEAGMNRKNFRGENFWKEWSKMAKTYCEGLFHAF